MAKTHSFAVTGPSSSLLDGSARDGQRCSMEQTHTLRSIQYLRGLAALAVTAMHTGWTYSGIGAAGVDIFFVISGFIMVHVSRRETAPLAFLQARALRVVPLYWLVTFVALMVRQDADLPRLLTSLAFWPHAGFDGRDYPVIIQGWTLNYEVFFYITFAASLLLPTSRQLLALTAAFSGLILAGIALHPGSVVAGVYTNPLLLEFLAGAWLCRVWQRGSLPTGRVAIALATIGALAFAAQVNIGPSDSWRCLTWGFPALLIVAGALGVEAGKLLPRVPGLLALGNASYALYLTHLLVEHPLQAVLRPLPLPLALPLMLAACVAVALGVYRWVEQPLARLRPAPRRTLAAGWRQP